MSGLAEASREYARRHESDDIRDLLRLAFREIRLLGDEVDEVRSHPATDYALFPRLRAALRVVLAAEAASLYEALGEAGTHGRERHRVIDRLVEKRRIELLLREIAALCDEDLALVERLDAASRQRIGRRYKQALKEMACT